MNQDDGPIGSEAEPHLLRVVTAHDIDAIHDLDALRAEHAELKARYDALGLSPIVLTPRVVAPLLAPPSLCPHCARQAAEFADERESLLRERQLALKSASTEQHKRLRVERALAESRATLVEVRGALASLRRARVAVVPPRRTGANPRRYGAD